MSEACSQCGTTVNHVGRPCGFRFCPNAAPQPGNGGSAIDAGSGKGADPKPDLPPPAVAAPIGWFLDDRFGREVAWTNNRPSPKWLPLYAATQPDASHAELLAIHEAVMNPDAVEANEADTFTLKMVKEFIQKFLEYKAAMELAEAWGKKP